MAMALVWAKFVILLFSWRYAAAARVENEADGAPAEERRGFVTFIDLNGHKEAQPFVDGAVMLGRSLQKYAPDFPRLVALPNTTPNVTKGQLTNAGWELFEVDDWHSPRKLKFSHWFKANVFRVPFDKAVYLDSDTSVRSSSVRELFDVRLPAKSIAMVKDVNPKQRFNSGVMVLTPEPSVYQELLDAMAAVPAGTTRGTDQGLINKVFADRVVDLPTKFNVHGSSACKSNVCGDAVVAHYTGPSIWKPTSRDLHVLEWVRSGRVPTTHFYGITCCPQLYTQFYCEMTRSQAYLSAALQSSLDALNARSAELGTCSS
jgi:hypothetical protein